MSQTVYLVLELDTFPVAFTVIVIFLQANLLVPAIAPPVLGPKSFAKSIIFVFVTNCVDFVAK